MKCFVFKRLEMILPLDSDVVMGHKIYVVFIICNGFLPRVFAAISSEVTAGQGL